MALLRFPSCASFLFNWLQLLLSRIPDARDHTSFSCNGEEGIPNLGQGPLMTLRDNLVVTLHDAEGNEISRTDVKTMSVVEKGVWDDLFPLKGGGRVHMKLLFILSEEERKRIQNMRESVVKKKEDKLIRKNPMHSNLATDAVVNDLPERDVQTKDADVSEEPIKDLMLNPIMHGEASQPGHGLERSQSDEAAPIRVGDLLTTHFIQEDRNNYKHDVDHMIGTNYRSTKETLKTQSARACAPPNHISPETSFDPWLEVSGPLSEDDHHTWNSASSVLEDKTHFRMDNSAGKVKKMISTFESNLFQGPRPPAIRSTKSLSNMIDMEHSFKNTGIDESSKGKGKPIQQDRKTRANIFSVRSNQDMNLRQTAKHIRSLPKKEPVDNIPVEQSMLFFDAKEGSRIENKSFEDKILFDACQNERNGAGRRGPERLYISGKETNPTKDTTDQVHEAPRSTEDGKFQSSQEKNFEKLHRKETGIEKVALWGNLDEAAAAGKARITGLDGAAQTGLQLDLSITQCSSDCNKDFSKLTIDGASKEKQKQLCYNNAKQCLLENPGSWIFHDEARHLCITTAEKKLRDMVGGFGICSEAHPSEMIADKMVESEICDNPLAIDKHDGANKFSKRRAKSMTGVPRKGGTLIEQIIRIAIIVACGTIFYSTRQRKTR